MGPELLHIAFGKRVTNLWSYITVTLMQSDNDSLRLSLQPEASLLRRLIYF